MTATLFLVTVAGGALTVTLEVFQFHDYSKEDLKKDLITRKIAKECHSSFRGAYYNHAVANDPNFRYTVTDTDGKKVAGTSTEHTQYTQTYYYFEWKEEGYDAYGNRYSYYDSAFLQDENHMGKTPQYVVTGGYDAHNPVTSGDMYWTLKAVDSLHGRRWIFLTVTVASLLLTGVGIGFLCLVAGRRGRQEVPILRGVNKIPFDLFLLLTGGGITGLVLLGWITLESERISLWLLCLPLLGWTASALLLALICSLAARIKVGGILRTSILGRVCIILFRTVERGRRLLGSLLQKIPTVPTVASVAGFLAACNIILGFLTGEPLAFLLLTLESVAGFFLALALALGFSSVEQHGRSIADGNLDYKMDTRFLAGPLKRHGETLNRIGDGLNTAVNERIKSERMKAELITNVSHDIKTPLTSIINYVDLLSKESEMNERTAEYLSVLNRQSARLKKLTDDIMEASKASSGALVLRTAPCDLGVLLEQTVGEYQEKTAEYHLTVLLSKPEQPVTVLADGQRLWRVFDNLMNNICKYALSGTRVYLGLSAEGDQAVITFRNISRDPLDLRPEELTERFVRGDRSRHGEGSGLGLAIARSFVELQQGTFDISVDADLFKVTITFPLLTENQTN